MALPTGPIPRVAVGEIIEEDWGDSVAQSLNNQAQMFDQMLWTPPSSIEATDSTTTWENWFRVGGSTAEILVPDWAHHLIARVEINGIRDARDDRQHLSGPGRRRTQ